MKRKSVGGASVTGMLLFFITIAVTVSLTVVIYAEVDAATGGNRAVIAGVILLTILALSTLCTVIDYLRRRYTVDKPVKKILDATDRIALGDFSVRLDIRHPIQRYDPYDSIMENLNKMAAELSRTEVLHTDFIANVSHELKTPLSVIQNYATSLLNPALDETTRVKYAQTLTDAAKRLTALITNILKLNKLENQEIKPEYRTIDLTETLVEAVLGYEEAIENKGLELVCDLDERITIRTIPAYLEIVWSNLLSNAIKFTERGGKLGVSLHEEDGRAVVKVSDTGCGISAETGAHIFEKFYQGDTSHAREGNGLGLALVKKVIDTVGGEISVDSTLGEGTVFTVRLEIET